ncbi:Fc.00g025600.m01.CDS01 [Cosmosporella sp. VM-42]
MLPSLRHTLGLVATVICAVSASKIQKDVVIIGGGASGAYAAVRLKEDYGKSILLVEKQDILGGHVDSFNDPATGTPYNYGVQSFIDMGNARAFFARLGIQTGAMPRVATTTRYVDFSTGEELEMELPSSIEQTAAITKYLALCVQYESIIQPGYFNFPKPSAIPSDLLMPFGSFVKKYQLEDAATFIFRVTGLGSGDITNVLTLYVMQAFGAPMARSILGQQDSFVPASLRNQDVYDAIQKRLGNDVMLSSTVISSSRSNRGVSLKIKNSKTGKVTEVEARRLLLAIQPTTSNLKPFDLDNNEKNVFSKFNYLRIFAGIVSNDALPVNVSLFNLPKAAQPDHYLEFPEPSFTARFDYIGQNKYFRIMMVTKPEMDTPAAQIFAQADIDRMLSTGVITKPSNGDSSKLKWVAWEDHGATAGTVSAKDLKAGFIQDLYSLQGCRSTWFTGAAWAADFQTTLWAFNDVLLPKLVASM